MPCICLVPAALSGSACATGPSYCSSGVCAYSWHTAGSACSRTGKYAIMHVQWHCTNDAMFCVALCMLCCAIRLLQALLPNTSKVTAMPATGKAWLNPPPVCLLRCQQHRMCGANLSADRSWELPHLEWQSSLPELVLWSSVCIACLCACPVGWGCLPGWWCNVLTTVPNLTLSAATAGLASGELAKIRTAALQRP